MEKIDVCLDCIEKEIEKYDISGWELYYTKEYFYLFNEYINNLHKPVKGKKVEFKIKAQFDKKYYVSARIADYAEDVYMSRLDGRFHVILDSADFELIELLYFNEREFIDYTLTFDNQVFVKKYSILGAYSGVKEKFVESYGAEKYLLVNDHLKSDILKRINMTYNDRCNTLYDEMKLMGRVSVVWKREYELFICIKNLLPDTLFQYTFDELEPQRFDIYIPSRKVAIEYQGEQHYSENKYFGGKESFEYRLELDRRKREIAKKNNITILNWPYSRKIRKNEFLEYIAIHNDDLKISFPRPNDPPIIWQNRTIEMAPKDIGRYHKQKEVKVNLKPSLIILQYDLNGNLVKKFDTIQEAAKEIGVSGTSIRKVLAGERNTCGGYVWRQSENNKEQEEKIQVTWSKDRINEGKTYPVIQMTNDYEIISEYESVSVASKMSGVNARSIKDCVNGHQKTAGGFVWKRKE